MALFRSHHPIYLELANQSSSSSTSTNAEATINVPLDKVHHLKKAFDGLETESTPDWIVYDFAAYWLSSTAAKLGISCALFSIANAWCMASLGTTSVVIDQWDSRSGTHLL
ncbi:unnamed protein product [Ilex paraguariensis]|uniref:Uncharacterized protein n=1 Tax=Ilex paraguariensis TaxID=185542 RepID=A0ABC8RRW0_9AQUA